MESSHHVGSKGPIDQLNSDDEESPMINKRILEANGRESLDSTGSLPYNTDINVEKIQVRQSKDGGSSPKPMRKNPTNKHVLQISFKKSELDDGRKQQSLLGLKRPGPMDAIDNSPIIVTSLD